MNPARAKVEREGRCRVCGAPAAVCDAAHTWDRGTWGGDFENEDLIVPLCSRIKGAEAGCHDQYDAKRLDLRSYLTTREQVAMVLACGSIERARTRLMGKQPEVKSTSAYGPFG